MSNPGLVRGVTYPLADYTLTTGWIPTTADWRVVSIDGSAAAGTQVSVVEARGRLTAMGLGDRVQFYNNGTTLMGIIHAKDAYQASTPGRTRFTVYHGTDYTPAVGPCRSPQYSHMKAPLGFTPDKKKWQVEVVATTGVGVDPAVDNTYTNPDTNVQITVPIGAWLLEMSAMGRALSAAGSTSVIARFGLSTANNALSDSTGNDIHLKTKTLLFTSHTTSGILEVRLPLYRSCHISLSSATLLYGVCAGSTSCANVQFDGTNGQTMLRAVSTYV